MPKLYIISGCNGAGKTAGYEVTLLCFWLSSPQMAIDRVAKRVSKGGHNIPKDVIERRYLRDLQY